MPSRSGCVGLTLFLAVTQSTVVQIVSQRDAIGGAENEKVKKLNSLVESLTAEVRHLRHELMLSRNVSGMETAARRLQQTEPPMKSVLLFRKPELETGQLEVVEEGLDVLRAQKEPFALVSAVGPTRTGKSTLLGRAFLRGKNENVFQIGRGVTSYTGGVWILTQPLKVQGKDGPLNVFLVDTEGFSGIGGLTSRTYEANLFGLTYLMSSAIIFNSMFPVNAQSVERLNAHCSHAVDMMENLRDNAKETWSRKLPKLVWSVQSFNLYNLQNSNISVDQFLDSLANSSHSSPMKAATHIQAASMLGGTANSDKWLLSKLFSSIGMVALRRPSGDDKVVANIDDYDSSQLSPEYLHDTERLKQVTFENLLPVHYCARKRFRSQAGGCTRINYDGEGFAAALLNWVKEGHVTDDSDAAAMNETAALEQFDKIHRRDFKKQCDHLRGLLQQRLKETPRTDMEKREEVMQMVLEKARKLPRVAMVRAVQHSQFWSHPARVSRLVEESSERLAVDCASELLQMRRRVEGNILEGFQVDEARQKWAAENPGRAVPPMRLVRTREGRVSFEIMEERVASLRQQGAKMITAKAATAGFRPQESVSRAREECFVVYD